MSGERRERVICEKIIWSGGGNPVTYAPARNAPSVDDMCALIRNMRDAMRTAIKAGDWKVDGACDPEIDLDRADAMLERLGAEVDDEFAEQA